MSSRFTPFLRIALVLGAFATFIGFPAALLPGLDLYNHARPATFAGFLVLVILALAAGSVPIRRWAIVGAAFNLALLATPLVWQAKSAATNPGNLTLLTWNANWENADLSVCASAILAADADVVLLQELTPGQAQILIQHFADRYPHRALCDATPQCHGAIVSKWPLGNVDRAQAATGMHGRISVTVLRAHEKPIRIAGFHLQFPGDAATQSIQITQAIAGVRGDLALGLPYVIAGDFNLTPWSYMLTRFTVATGLSRHTLNRSWPADGMLGFPVAAFPIDHVFSTPDVKTVAIETGPGAGSDHHMVFARLAY